MVNFDLVISEECAMDKKSNRNKLKFAEFSLGLFSAVFCLFLLYSCCSGPTSEVRTIGNEGRIKLQVQPDDAIVYVDGEKKGKAAKFDGDPEYLFIPSGFHRLELKKEGYKTYSRKLYSGNAIQEIKVILSEVE
jgi:hypothetical protein